MLRHCPTLFLATIFLLAVSAGIPSAAQSARTWIGAAILDLNLRAEPDWDAPVLEVIRKDGRVEVVGKSGDWLEVRRWKNGGEAAGWVPSEFLRRATPPSGIAPPVSSLSPTVGFGDAGHALARPVASGVSPGDAGPEVGAMDQAFPGETDISPAARARPGPLTSGAGAEKGFLPSMGTAEPEQRQPVGKILADAGELVAWAAFLVALIAAGFAISAWKRTHDNHIDILRLNHEVRRLDPNAGEEFSQVISQPRPRENNSGSD
ncbi:MAG: SH3 domain-containing protein [Desulfatibacillaceae bacterium]